MTAIVALVVLAAVCCVALALWRSVDSCRAEQERQGLFGAQQERIRRAVDEARASLESVDTIGHVKAASAQLTDLVFSGARLTSIGPLLGGWWQLAFADGTTLFVVPEDRRTCRLEPRHRPTVIRTWSPSDSGVYLVLDAAGRGSQRILCRDLFVVPGHAP